MGKLIINNDNYDILNRVSTLEEEIHIDRKFSYPSDYLVNNIYFHKLGRIVYFTYVSDSINVPIGEFIICSISNELIPIENYIVMGAFTNQIQIIISTNGQIQGYNYSENIISERRACRFSGSYISKY